MMSEKQHLKKVVEQYRKNTPKSSKLFDETTGLLPGGIGGSAPSFDPYPMFIKKGDGSKLLDVDGNEYVDFNLCWGVLFVGHRHPKLMKGLQDQLEYGTMFGLPHAETLEAAKELARRFPVIDTVRFVNSGSEATSYAIRLARRYAQKDKIIKIEGAYHGIADSLHISKRPSLELAGPESQPNSVPYGKGITENTIKNTLVAPFNNIGVIEKLVNDNPNEIAAVIVEPVMMNSGVIPPQDGYLRTLRKITEDSDIVLIFDEVKTGVKIAPGGATEYFGVTPDLVSLAKAIGGGLPLGACGGKKEIMAEIDKEGLFGTFSANPLSIRACKITLTDILTDSKYDKVERLGKTLLSGYQDIIEDNQLGAIVQGINATGGILFTEDPVNNYRSWTKVNKAKTHEYWLAMVNEGVIPMAYGAEEEWLISVQHSEDDIQKHLEAFKEVALHL